MGQPRAGNRPVTFRSRKLLDLCHDTPCQATFPHNCSGTIVPAHSNQQLFGRGHAFKADDCFVAAVCPDAHDYIDGRKGGWEKEMKHAEWMRAHIATVRWWWENDKLKVAA